MSSQFFFSLDSIKPQKKSEGGSLTSVTAKEVPGFVNISFASLKLNKGGFHEPIWHPNANKIGHCVQGNALVTMRTPGSVEVFNVEEGDIFFIPKGYFHYISNSSGEENIINFALDNTNPQTMCFFNALNSLSDTVFTATFNSPAGFVNELKKSKNSEFIKTLPSKNGAPKSISSRYKFNIASSVKAINDKGGYLQLTTKTNLPVLDGLGILGFGLNPKGVVEPHWHTNAGELVYIIRGKTRITVLAPDGKVDVMEVSGGQGAFAPASHFHSIENIGDENVDVIAYFSNSDPDYMGFGEVLGTCSNEMLATIFNVPANYFNNFTKPEGPLVIVPVK